MTARTALWYNAFKMSFTLDKIFTTATALIGPDSVIREYAPCDALRPYIRCFWESDGASADTALRIIPDCCADILISSSDNAVRSHFCGVNSQSFLSYGSVRTFGIRFYAWSVRLFSSVAMNGTRNAFLPAEAVFNDFSAVATEINQATAFLERIAIAQKYLLKRLRRSTENSDVMNCFYQIIARQARVTVSALSDDCAIGRRALERNFRAHTGLSPKEAIEIIRYQLLWQQCLQVDFDVLDGVEQFGFYDAPHLYNDFKKYHGISLPQAVNYIKTSHFYNTYSLK